MRIDDFFIDLNGNTVTPHSDYSYEILSDSNLSEKYINDWWENEERTDYRKKYPLNMLRDFCRANGWPIPERISHDAEEGSALFFDTFFLRNEKCDFSKILIQKYERGESWKEAVKYDTYYLKEQTLINKIKTAYRNTARQRWDVGLISGYKRFMQALTIKAIAEMSNYFGEKRERLNEVILSTEKQGINTVYDLWWHIEDYSEDIDAFISEVDPWILHIVYSRCWFLPLNNHVENLFSNPNYRSVYRWKERENERELSKKCEIRTYGVYCRVLKWY